MCLRYITDRHPMQGVFVGYKLFMSKRGLFTYRGLCINKYYKKYVLYSDSSRISIRTTDEDDKYFSGFHIFKTIEDLELYAKPHCFYTPVIMTKVLYSAPLYEGIDRTHNCCTEPKVVVAAQMKIIEELGYVISTNANFATEDFISKPIYYSANKVGKPIQIPATLL